MRATIKCDPSRFHRATRELAALARKKPVQDVFKKAASQVVRQVIDITPPAKGGPQGAEGAKKRGEASIDADLARIFRPLTTAALKQIEEFQGRSRKSEFGHRGAKALGEVEERILSLGEMTAWHSERRSRRTGRVMKVNRDATTGLRRRDLRGLDTGLVAKTDFNTFRQRLKSQVGWLAHGWNKAAELLGTKVPQWIRRHGTSDGVARLTVSAHGLRLFFGNDVKFVDNIRGLERRLQWALDQVAKSILERQIPAALKGLARRAGFKAR